MATILLLGCGSVPAASSDVAADVLFLVLGKMALYDQSQQGKLTLRNYHFVAEIMPREGRKIISGTLVSKEEGANVLPFQPEGNAFLAHGARVTDPAALHQLHPDGEYLFSYQTQSGRMESQPVVLEKRANIDQMPAASRVTLSQVGEALTSKNADPDADLVISWQPMSGNTKIANSDLEDLIFVLAFDCFGENVAHSGRPYQGGPYLTFRDSQFTIPASSLVAGMNYKVIVEQATADVTIYLGVPGIATYASLTFVDFRTDGDPASCPAKAR